MSRFEKWSVWVTTLLTGLTGLAYMWTKYLMSPSDAFAVVNHPLQPLFLKAHIVVSPLLIFALGMIALRHVWTHFRTGVRISRKSGIITALAVIPMVSTGYLIQVLTGEGWVRAMALSHIAFGMLYLVGIGLHQWFLGGERRRRRATIPGNETFASGKPGAPEEQARSHAERRTGDEQVPAKEDLAEAERAAGR